MRGSRLITEKPLGTQVSSQHEAEQLVDVPCPAAATSANAAQMRWHAECDWVCRPNVSTSTERQAAQGRERQPEPLSNGHCAVV